MLFYWFAKSFGAPLATPSFIAIAIFGLFYRNAMRCKGQRKRRRRRRKGSTTNWSVQLLRTAVANRHKWSLRRSSPSNWNLKSQSRNFAWLNLFVCTIKTIMARFLWIFLFSASFLLVIESTFGHSLVKSHFRQKVYEFETAKRLSTTERPKRQILRHNSPDIPLKVWNEFNLALSQSRISKDHPTVKNLCKYFKKRFCFNNNNNSTPKVAKELNLKKSAKKAKPPKKALQSKTVCTVQFV